jgi:hypothetical protein
VIFNLKIAHHNSNLINLIRILIFSFIFSAIPYFGSSSADAAVTYYNKIITIKDSNNVPYVGATVGINGYDQSITFAISNEADFYAPEQITSETGTVVLRVPSTVLDFSITVFPRVDDSQHAVFTKSFMNKNNENLELKLSLANIWINPVTSSGSNARKRTIVYGDNFWFPTTREEKFGINIETTTIKSWSQLYVYPSSAEVKTQKSNYFSIKRIVDSGVAVTKLYNSSNIELSKPNGVYQLPFGEANVFGRLKNSNGSKYDFPTGVKGSVTIFQSLSNSGNLQQVTSVPVDTENSEWAEQLELDSGKYLAMLNFENSLDLGQADLGFFYVQAGTGKFSKTLSGTYTTTLDLETVVNPTIPNFTFTVKEPTGQNIGQAVASLRSKNKNFYVSMFTQGGPISKNSYRLVPGTYYLTLFPVNAEGISASFTVTISETSTSVIDQEQKSILASGGVFNLSYKPVNMKYKYSDSSGNEISDRNGWSAVFDSATSEVGWGQYFSNNVSASYIPSGPHKLVYFPGGINENAGVTSYDVRGYGETVTVNDGSVTPTDSIYSLALNQSNFKAKIVEADDSTAVAVNAYVNICKNNATGLDARIYGCLYVQINESGTASTYLTDGSYQILVDGGKYNTVNRFAATVSGGTVSITGKSKDGSGKFVLNPAKPNLIGTVKLPDGSVIPFNESQGIDLQIIKIISNGNEEWINSAWYGEGSTNFGFSLKDEGKYQVRGYLYGITEYSSFKSDYIYVNSSGQISRSQSSGFTDEINDYEIRLAAGNLLIYAKNPLNNQYLTEGCISVYSNTSDVKSAQCLNTSNEGKSAFLLDQGTYNLNLNVWNNPLLTSRDYTVEVSNLGVATLKLNGITVTKENDRFVISPESANITGRVVDPSGQPNQFGGWGEVQKYNLVNQSWEYIGKGVQIGSDGFFGTSIKSVGKYRVLVRPHNRSDLARTYSETFEITSANLASFFVDLGTFNFATPNFKVYVRQPGSSQNLENLFVSLSQIEVIKSEESWQYTWPNGGNYAGFVISNPGTYLLDVNPPYDKSLPENTSKNYRIVVTKNSAGELNISIGSQSGLSKDGDVYIAELGSANLKGTVTAANGTTLVGDAYVVARNISTGQEYSSGNRTDSTGRWALTLSSGTYKLQARAPSSNIEYGNSDYTEHVVVNAAGEVTAVPAGKSAGTFNISLKSPTWSGVIKNPAETEPVPYSGLCIDGFHTTSGEREGFCSQSNNKGEIAISVSADFDFDSNSRLTLYDWQRNSFPPMSLQGKTAITNFLGSAGTNKIYKFQAANVKITVTADGEPVPNIYLNAERPNQWLANARTNASGIAEMYIADLTADIKFMSYVEKSQSGLLNFVSTDKTFTASQITAGTAGGIFSETLALRKPNFNVIVRTPQSQTDSGTVVSQSWVEIWNVTDQEWVNGLNTFADGTASGFLKGGCCVTPREYRLKVYPPWGSTTNFAIQQYKILVDTMSVVSIFDAESGSLISSEQINNEKHFQLTLGKANFAGVVLDPLNTPVNNSFVYSWPAVWDKNSCQASNCYSWSRNDGSFALSLSNGRYIAGAENPYGTSNFVNSERCDVTVENKIASGNCIQPDGSVKLQLRGPNLTFVLKNNGTALQDASVSISIGSWSTYGRVGTDGRVSIFIDKDAISLANAANPAKSFLGISGIQKINVYVDTWGSNSIKWNCQSGINKPICSQLSDYLIGSTFADLNLGDVEIPRSNVQITVNKPDNSGSGEGSYVEIYRFNSVKNYWMWEGNGRTNSSSQVNFNIDTSTVDTDTKFKVYIRAAWAYKDEFTDKSYDNSGLGFTFDEIKAAVFKLGSPNLTLTIQTPSGQANRFGSVVVEEIEGDNSPIEYIAGTRLNESGKAAINLPALKKFRITTTPGNGNSGATTQCYIQTDTSSVVTLTGSPDSYCGSVSATAMTISLARGNIVGTIYGLDTSTVSGAIIYANVDGATDEENAIIACSTPNGEYGITLKAGLTYRIKVYPINKVGTEYNDKTDLGTVTAPPSGYTTLDIRLTPKT